MASDPAAVARLTGLADRVVVVATVDEPGDVEHSIVETMAEAGCRGVVAGTLTTARPPTKGWLRVACDISDAASVDALADAVLSEFGRVDFVVTHVDRREAGAGASPTVTSLREDDWNTVVSANLRSAFLVSRRFARIMVGQGDGGALVTLASVAGEIPVPGQLAYSAAQAAVRTFNACLATELGAQHVRVNTVCLPLSTSHSPVGDGASGRDVADIVAFLCSTQGAWVTGEHIDVSEPVVRSPGEQVEA